MPRPGVRPVSLPVLVLLAVFAAIAFRRVGRLRIRIWQAMGAGALAVLLSGHISPAQALRSIDPDVMLFLFGMFVVGEALVASGYLYTLACHTLGRTRSTDTLVLAVLFGAGLASALLMNDTLAIVGTPLMLRLAGRHRIDGRVLLLTLSFAVTTGSVMSPIGNPQNLLIAIGGGMASPFVTFLRHCAPRPSPCASPWRTNDAFPSVPNAYSVKDRLNALSTTPLRQGGASRRRID